MIYTTHYSSPVGDLLLAAKDDALVGLWISGQKYFLGSLKEPMQELLPEPPKQSPELLSEPPKQSPEKLPGGAQGKSQGEQSAFCILLQAASWLDLYFAGEKPELAELKLAPMGSGFRQAVWKILCEIPYGEVTTYGEISKKVAAMLGKAHMSSQAVGGAVGHNPISIIIPCHRVVGANGSLTGYAGGIDKKVQLLVHEGVSMQNFFIPTKSTAPTRNTDLGAKNKRKTIQREKKEREGTRK